MLSDMQEIEKKEGPEFTNRLIQEQSPYLLQHAHNPVDWYPWCPEAFERAEKEGKLVFLSIGYSTCHWCHVMEQESFEDREVAELLNRDYISIKTDREERPEIDGVYMNVCQMMNGSGGWPLTIIMTAEQKPLFAGTYFPKTGRHGQIGLMELLTQISRLWKQEQKRVLQTAEDITKSLKEWEQEKNGEKKGEEESERLIEEGVRQLKQMFDKAYGGFGKAPKFPVPHQLLFLLKRYEIKGETQLLAMAETTLCQMYRGGLFDHLGGGFSRYSTDARFLVPHFEKMLYDNALLSLAYLEAFRLTENVFYERVADRTLSYMERELMHEKGGFFCGQDADVQGEEGKYYVFTPQEIQAVLGEESGGDFCRRYGVTEKGNFEGNSILHLLDNEEYQKETRELLEQREKLFQYRKGRMELPTDDKILASWNGLAVWAFARAYQITGRTAYYKRAKKAAAFVRANMMTLNGKMKVRWRNGQVAMEGNLDDYAFYGLALLELYQCDFDISWLRSCLGLAEEMIGLFEDKELGGFFFYGAQREQLISRPKETYDGAMPSGNSAAGLLLTRLFKLTGDKEWEEAARRQISFLKQSMGRYQAGHTMALLAVLAWEQEGIHLVCTTKEEIPEEEIRCYRKRQKSTVSAVVMTQANRKSLIKLLPGLSDYRPEEEIRYYVCRGKSCQPPAEELLD